MTAPEGTMSVSMTTPESARPSIHSMLETQPSDGRRSGIVTHDINRLLQHLHETDQHRSGENRALAGELKEVHDELRDLSDYLRQKPPVVPSKDRGGLQPHLIPVPLTPPPMRALSPSISSDGTSFLSSHHSDDLSLLESETYPHGSPPSSNGSSSSSPYSGSSDLPESFVTASSTTSGPYLSHTSSSPSLPPPSEAPSSSSEATVRPPPREGIRDMLDRLADQIGALWDGQLSTNHMLDEMRARRPPQDDELAHRLNRIEDLLRRLIGERPESMSSDSSDGDRRWRDFLNARGRPIYHQPTALRPSLDEQLQDLLGATIPAVPATGIQGPPPFVPFSYNPSRRRPRSASPTLDLPQRAATAPTDDQGSTYSRPRRRRQGYGRPESIMTETLTESAPPGRRTVPDDADIDFERRLRDLRRQRRPDAPDGVFDTTMPPQEVVMSPVY